MLLIDEKGENLGVKTLQEALKLAHERGLDLVEISPNANPPVAKIISYDKYRYQMEKGLKKQRQAQKASEIRQIRITPRAAKNDLEIKMRKLVEFLEEGNRVEILLFLRGREKANRDWARMKLLEFLKMIPVEHKILTPVKFMGQNFIAQVGK